jgi:hypothetical protein
VALDTWVSTLVVDRGVSYEVGVVSVETDWGCVSVLIIGYMRGMQAVPVDTECCYKEGLCV